MNPRKSMGLEGKKLIAREAGFKLKGRENLHIRRNKNIGVQGTQ